MLKRPDLPVVRHRGVCCDVEVVLPPDRAQHAAELIKVLADPTRLSILVTLRKARQPLCVCDFVAAYGLSQPTISHHVGKLRAAGLVSCDKEGLWGYYRIAELPLLVQRMLDAIAVS